MAELNFEWPTRKSRYAEYSEINHQWQRRFDDYHVAELNYREALLAAANPDRNREALRKLTKARRYLLATERSLYESVGLVRRRR